MTDWEKSIGKLSGTRGQLGGLAEEWSEVSVGGLKRSRGGLAPQTQEGTVEADGL